MFMPRVLSATFLVSLSALFIACGGDDPPKSNAECAAGESCECFVDGDCPAGEVCGSAFVCVSGEVDAGVDADGDVTVTPDATDDTDVPDTVMDAGDTAMDVSDAMDGSGDDVMDVGDVGTPDVSDVDVVDAVDGETDSADVSDASDVEEGDAVTPVQPIVQPWIAFTSEALFDLTLPDSSPRPLEDVLSSQIMLTRAGEPFALHIATGDQIHSSPTWSPDGKLIAYLAGRVTERELKTVNIETAEVLTISGDLPVNPASLAWTRDGSAIIMAAFPGDGSTTDVGLDLFRVDIETAVITNLTNTNGISENTPRCLPDGRVYFVQTDDGQTSIARMPDAGGEITELAPDTGIGGTIGVSPDGQFAFGTVVDRGEISFVRVDLETGDVTTLPDNNRGAVDVALDNSMMVGLAVLSDDQALVPLNPFTAAVTGSRYNSQPRAEAHPGIDINPRPRLAAPAVAPVSGTAVDLAEAFGGSGT